jgi:hypothetical protein
MVKSTRPERRMERREMHVDRRKSDLDVIEHVALGIRRTCISATSNDRRPQTRSRK